MARDEERLRRAEQGPIVGSLPDVPGIGVAMRPTPALGTHLRGLADAVLVDDFPGATLRRDQRELLATAVSAANDCFFCMDSHGAFANALLERADATELMPLIETVKDGSSDGFDPKMQALLHVARTVRHDPLRLTADDVAAASAAGATDADVQLAVLIASAFSMYNRLVDGFRAKTAPTTDVYHARAAEIAELGYSAPSPSAAVPLRCWARGLGLAKRPRRPTDDSIPVDGPALRSERRTRNGFQILMPMGKCRSIAPGYQLVRFADR